jgi:hypothetical protein
LFTNTARRLAGAIAAAVVLCAAAATRADAIPLFAQRYHLDCRTCHTVIPELNSFGLSFRNHGYRLPLPKHGTTGAALRYQMEYERDPPSGQRRWSPGGIVLSQADLGQLSAFLHYNLGAGGGPSAVYLGYLSYYNAKTDTTYRAGYIELPYVQSPGQRLDDLQAYGYYTTRVGLNNLTLASPRIGIEADRTIDGARVAMSVALGEYDGAAYGGKPLATGEATYMSRPEIGLFSRVPVIDGLEVTTDALLGQRSIGVVGKPSFEDLYQRYAVGLHAKEGKFDLLAQQWYGYDGDSDGAGDNIASSGGFVRVKYYPGPHGYLGIRYDTAANPYATRDMVFYGAIAVTPWARVLVQDVHHFGSTGKDALGGALTIGFPPPLKL